MHREWYYLQDEKQIGPVSEHKIRDMLRTEELSKDVYLWTESLDAWKKAKDIDLLTDKPTLSPDEIVVEDSKEDPVTVAVEEKTVRPWVRYWARQLDYLFAGMLVMLVVSPAYFLGEASIGLVSMIVWIFLEAALLATWGWTPGKYFLKVRVRDASGEKLSFTQALLRGFRVWVVGMGCGAPFLSMIAMWWGHNSLLKKGVTYWDDNGSIVVVHEDKGSMRLTIVVAVLAVLILLALFWGSSGLVAEAQTTVPVIPQVLV
jgi:uncharacterized RDD family membrane protein YckC